MSGFINFAAQAIPEINPPPPIGTKIISVSGNSFKISNAFSSNSLAFLYASS